MPDLQLNDATNVIGPQADTGTDYQPGHPVVLVQTPGQDQLRAVIDPASDPRQAVDTGGGSGGGNEAEEAVPTPPAVTTVTSVTPPGGPKGSAVPLTITGTGLTATTQVRVGADVCTSLSVVSDAAVTATTLDTAAKGTYPVVVTVDGADVTGPTFQVT